MNRDLLVARIDALERQNRLIRIALATVLLLAVSTVLMAQIAPEYAEVRGTRFVLVDAQGTRLGTLGVVEGAPSLELRDRHGVLLRLGSAGSRAAVGYRDKRGRLLDLTQPAHEVTPLK